MHRTTLIRHLRRAQQHVEQGHAHVARQRAIVQLLEARGDEDVSRARGILQTLEDMQATHVFDRDRLERALAEGDQPFSTRDDVRRLESAHAITHASMSELRWYHDKLAETGRRLARSKAAFEDSCEILSKP